MDESAVTDKVLLLRLASELKVVRELVSKLSFALHEAEGEIPQKMRRFASYYHDIVHIKGEYVYTGGQIAMVLAAVADILRREDIAAGK